MKKQLLTIGIISLGLALTGILLCTGNSPGDPKGARWKAGSAGEGPKVETVTAVASENVVSLEHLPDRAPTKAETLRVLDQVMEVLRAGDPVAIKDALTQLDKILLGDHHDAATGIAAIMEFLKSGKDAPTGEGFKVGEGGLLSEATTMRVQLMDRLGRLSREAGSSAGLEAARDVLRRPESADEWAVSMRNVAWLDPASREYLAERVTAMLQHEPWRQNPSAGMLEAFDLIVHTGAVNNVPELSRFIAGDEGRLGGASSVAIDRLAATHPLEFASMLNRQPDLLADMPFLRADLLSRVDLSNGAQRQQAENYLMRADVSAEERGKFLASLVERGQFVSNNLLTPYPKSETPEEGAARIEVVAGAVNEWLRDERFASYRAELAQLGTTINQIDDAINADRAK